MKFDREIFFGRYRQVFGKLTQSQVDGLNQMLNFAEQDPNFTSVRQLAYAFATVQRETNVSKKINGKMTLLTFNPITELGGRSYFNRYEGRKDLGNNRTGDGFLYRGRGYVQITGRRNYTEFEKLLGEKLVSDPDLALTPKVAWEILSKGMRDGVFVPGQTLNRYIPLDDRQQADYFTARRIINPGEIKVKPSVVREMAANALKWEALLRAALVSTDVVVPESSETGTTTEPATGETQENNFDMMPNFHASGIIFEDGGTKAKIKGFIGGEAHDVYVTHFQRNSEVKMVIKSKENRAGFSVCDNTFTTVEFGQYSEDGQTWTATIPSSGAYYIDIVAHPDAKYTLTINVKQPN